MHDYWIGDRFPGSTSYVRHSHLYDDPITFHFLDDALQFLRGAVSDFDVLCTLRTWAADRWSGQPRHDHDLLKYAAACLVSGELVARPLVKHPPAGQVDIFAQPDDVPDNFGSAPRRRSASRPVEAPSSDPDIDIERQIAALRAAAKDGAPFCEQCERAKLEAAR